MRILQINTIDEGGGAAVVASSLMRGYRARGHRVWQVVGRKQGADPAVLVIREDRRPFYRLIGYSAVQMRLRRLAGRFPDRGFGLAGRVFRMATHPSVIANTLRGVEDFDFPGSYEVLDMPDKPPQVVQCHNLHGGYFDLRALQQLSARVPTVLTLHDMWTLTGHCAHALDCERWRTGCGACPDLTLDPPVRADATALNWTRKQASYRGAKLHVATPSEWLMSHVRASMLAPAVADARVIPNGVDLSVFHPGEREGVRRRLNLPRDAFVVLLTTGSRGSMWKDDYTLRRLINTMPSDAAGRPPYFVALGRESALPPGTRARVQSVPFQTNPHVVADYCRAADVYVHASRADTAPLAVLEALACGTPVVATRIGGIPEQVRHVDVAALAAGRAALGEGTGVLVPPRDPAAVVAAIDALRRYPETRRILGANAVADVAARFSLDRQVDAYLSWYRRLVPEPA